MVEIVFASRNPTKMKQFRSFFRSKDFKIYSMDDVGVIGEAEENGKSLSENSMLKARYVHKRLKPKGRYWIIADDTGFYINALNGKPGIKAQRWAGDNKTTEEITQYTLNKLKNHTDRTATFATTLVIISPQGQEMIVTGEVNGTILREPRLEAQPNMPYSPIFVPEGSKKVWAQMTPAEENKLSHRGKAFLRAKKVLENFVNRPF